MPSRRIRSAALRPLGRAFVATLAVVVGVAVSAGPARAQDFTMKFATLTINDIQHEFIKMYKAELEKTTNNRIKVDVYPAGQLGGGAGRPRACGSERSRRRPDRRSCSSAPIRASRAWPWPACSRTSSTCGAPSWCRSCARPSARSPARAASCCSASWCTTPRRSCSKRRSPSLRISPASASACWRARASRRRSMRSAARRCRCRSARCCPPCTRARSTAPIPACRCSSRSSTTTAPPTCSTPIFGRS